jgi:hypothetical protein
MKPRNNPQVLVAFAVLWRGRQDLAAWLGMKPFERLDRGARGFGSGVAWIVTLFQETRELVAIEPPPACPQAGEKFEFAACEDRHNSARLDACGRAEREAPGHYLFCIPAYCLPL